jgi:SulP family sulfate permease
MSGTRHDSNQELIGQGIANIVVPFFGGFAATGAVARTATNIRNGGTSPLSGMIHSVTVILCVVFLAPLAAHIPLATLAAILFVVAWNMSDLKHFMTMMQRAPRADVIILLITFLLTIFADLVIAVNVGVTLAILQFVHQMSGSLGVQCVTAEELNTTLPDGVLVYSVGGPFFFGAVEHFERALAQTHTDPQILIIRLNGVPLIDITGLRTLEGVIRDLHGRGVLVMLTEAHVRVESKLKRGGIINMIGRGNFFKTCDQALELCRTLVILQASQARTAV